MVVAELTVSFALVVEDDCKIPKFLWQMLLVPHGLEQTCQLVVNGFTTCVEHFSRDAVRAWSFPTHHMLDCFADLFKQRRGIKL